MERIILEATMLQSPKPDNLHQIIIIPSQANNTNAPCVVPNSASSQGDFSLKRALNGIPNQEMIFKILTDFPTSEALEEACNLADRQTELKLSTTIRNLYSYITQRPYQENTEDFFFHIVGDVLYELHFDIKIGGKSHYTKAANLLNEVNKTIETLKNHHTIALGHDNIEQAEILNKHIINFSLHYNALLFSLKAHPKKSTKQQLKKSHNINLGSPKFNYIHINLEEQTISRTLYHETPSPKKGQSFFDKTTPKKVGKSVKRALELSNDIQNGLTVEVKLMKMLISSNNPQGDGDTPPNTTPPPAEKNLLVLFNLPDDGEDNEVDDLESTPSQPSPSKERKLK